MMKLRSTMTGASLALAAALGLAAAATPLIPTAAAHAQTGVREAQAEQFVQSNSQVALGILSDRGRSIADKSRAFRGFVDQVADVPKITNFVLGKYARTLTPEQKARFATVFRDYASYIYESRLGEYRGETFRVTGSLVRRPGDVIVNSVVSGGHLDQPIPVNWRVQGGGDAWKVVDVQVKGVWLGITEQQDFVSTMDNHHGDVDVLIDQMQKSLADARAKRAE
jgi:phospholipid transport system substrate-binding protein